MIEPARSPGDSRRRTARRGRRALSAAVVAGLLLAGCTGDGDDTGDRPGGPAVSGLRLVSFDSCQEAEQRLRAAMLAHLESWSGPQLLPAAGDGAERAGVPGGGPVDTAGRAAPAAPDLAAGDAVALAPEAVGPAVVPAPHSGTNVHERGVDEPDLVKTDGRRIVTVTDGVLRVVDAARRVQTGSLNLAEHGISAYPADLLLHGDLALLLAGGGAPVPMPLPVPGPGVRPGPDGRMPEPAGFASPARPGPEPVIAGPQLVLVDLTGQPTVRARYQVDGVLVDARATGSTVRVVVRSAPRFRLPMVDPAADEAERLKAYQQAVGEVELADWLPRYRLTVAGGATTTGQVDCTAVSHPPAYSGGSMLTVLTFDLADGTLGDGQPVSVVADGDTVYSNGTSLYIATDRRWLAPTDVRERDGAAGRTDIYTFDLSQPGPPRYVATGSVPGWLVNQYAMSEWDGHLRVATTAAEVAGEQAGSVRTESTVYVLADRGGALVTVGTVDGLGVGERIYSVRFAGPVGYVVTFRETDPLYTLDLTDPTAPAVRGELKITGYSSYLHPVGDGRLLGVGQEADGNGVVQGTQVSLFDVSDLTRPRVLDRHLVAYGASAAETDPHAFLWWEPAQTVVLPVSAAVGSAGRAIPQSRVLVLRVDGDQLVEAGYLSHPGGDSWPYGVSIHRSLVIGGTLWTLSDAGLQANDLMTLRTTGWVPFG